MRVAVGSLPPGVHLLQASVFLWYLLFIPARIEALRAEIVRRISRSLRKGAPGYVHGSMFTALQGSRGRYIPSASSDPSAADAPSVIAVVIRVLTAVLAGWLLLTAASGCGPDGVGGDGESSTTTGDTVTTTRDTVAAGAEVTLLSVADGDTITVRTAEGEEEKVRYIGLDAPEMAGDGEPAEPLAVEAAAFNRGLLTGRALRLETDREERDDYGRLLAYVYADEVFVNREMVRTGHARARSYPPNLEHQTELDAAETKARRERVGIWSRAQVDGPEGEESAASVSEAGVVSWPDAAGYVGRTVTVEGPVVGTHWARATSGAPTFLNVGREYPEPGRLTVVIWGEDRSRFPAPPDQRYYGKTIRVTGSVEMYEGSPEIVISSPADIEIVD